LLAVLALVASLTAGCTSAPVPRSMPESNERLVLVMAADPAIERLDLRGARSGAYRQPRRYPGLPSSIASDMKDLAAEHQLQPVDHWPMLSLGVQCFVFEAPADGDVNALVARLAADPRVESAQRMNSFELKGSDESAAWDDPYRGLQGSLDQLDVTQAHRWSTGRGVRIAVIDTGVDATHPELSGQIAERRNFVGGSVDAGGERHGTAIAGIIASQAGNRQGIVGIAPGARLLALKACEQRQPAGKGSCTTFDLARAIDYAIGTDADVVNLSLGGPRDPLLERLLVQAIGRNVVVVAAAGEASFPATLTGVIAVRAENPAHPPSQALTAPGVDVLSLAPPDGYDYFSGDSIAAAQVSGIVALLLQRAPQLRPADIRPLLARTARRPGIPGQDTQLQVSACAALAAVRTGVSCSADASRAQAADARGTLPSLETH
jgi:hypothetical protein